MTAEGVDRPRQVEQRLQVHEVTGTSARELLAIVRCIAGPARLGTRFCAAGQESLAVNLVLVRIQVYGRDVEGLGQGWTARVTFAGPGAQFILSGQVLQDVDPDP